MRTEKRWPSCKTAAAFGGPSPEKGWAKLVGADFVYGISTKFLGAHFVHGAQPPGRVHLKWKNPQSDNAEKK